MSPEHALILFYVLAALLAVLLPCWLALRTRRHEGNDDGRERY